MSRERWQELDRHAPSAPWVLTRAHNDECEGLHLIRRISDPVTDQAMAEFIAAARTGWPAAERECEQLRALLRQVRDAVGNESNWAVAQMIDDSGLLDGGQQQ